MPLTYKAILVTASGLFLTLVAAGPLILKKLHTSIKPKISRKKATKPALKFSESDSSVISNISEEKKEPPIVSRIAPEEHVIDEIKPIDIRNIGVVSGVVPKRRRSVSVSKTVIED